MPDQKSRRCKMISLRLSEREYEALRRLYPSYGARDISDFVRLAIHRVIRNSLGSDGALLTKVDALNERLSAVEAHLFLLPEREKVMS